jgi:iron complex outermembrane receptor protein
MNIKIYIIILYAFFGVLSSFAQGINKEEKDTAIYLNEVFVNAYQINTRQHQVPGAISVLSEEEIRNTDGNNFSHTLHTIPGIFMHSGTYATSRIIIRGVGSRTPYNTNRIKSYLNDIPITSSDGISTPEDIDLMGIGRMEVIKGPASALYGSGLGGNINLYTPNRSGNYAESLIQYGSFNTIKAAAGGNYSKGNLNIWSNMSHLYSDGYRENSKYKRTSLLSSGMWQQERFSIEYTLILIDLNSQIPSSVGKTLYEINPRAAATNWKDIEGFKEYQRAIAGVTLTNRLASNWNNKFTVFGRWADSYERRPFNNLDDGTSGGGLRNRLSYNNSHWDALVGFEWVNDVYHWQMDVNEVLINNNRETRNNYNLFGMVYLRPTSKWNISIGGAVNRVNYQLIDQYSENGDQSGKRNFPAIFSPRFGVNYAPSSLIAFYGSVGHGFSMPSPEETLLPEGDINNDLKPEQGIQYEFGTRVNLFNNATRFEISVYRIDLTNLLVTKRITEDLFTGINAGETKHWGIEFMLNQNIFKFTSFPGRMDLSTNYTWSSNKFIDFFDNEQLFNGNLLPGIPSHIAHTFIKWQPLKRFSIDSQFQFVGKQYIDDANKILNYSYFLSTLKAIYRLPNSKFGYFELFVGVINLSNTHYSPMLTVNAVAFGNAEPRYFYPGLPRHYYGGVRFNINSLYSF